MGKKKQNKQTEKQIIKFNLSTKSDDIIKELDCCITKYFPNSPKSKAVVAKDDKGEYITATSYIDTNLLDPYKMYNRIGL